MQHYALIVLLGLFAGFASALLGIGGGVIMVPALTLMFSAGWVGHAAGFEPIKVATATSLAYIVPVALVGALRTKAPAQWTVVLIAVPAGVIGAYLGAMAKDRIPAAQLKVLFALLMFVAGARLGLKGWHEWQAGAPENGRPPPAADVSLGEEAPPPGGTDGAA
jgi:uncharacterized membrane protein YfcA